MMQFVRILIAVYAIFEDWQEWMTRTEIAFESLKLNQEKSQKIDVSSLMVIIRLMLTLISCSDIRKTTTVSVCTDTNRFGNDNNILTKFVQSKPVWIWRILTRLTAKRITQLLEGLERISIPHLKDKGNA